MGPARGQIKRYSDTRKPGRGQVTRYSHTRRAARGQIKDILKQGGQVEDR